MQRIKCLAQGHKQALLSFEPATLQPQTYHSTTEPLCSSRIVNFVS